ncbi:HAMP domain-containing sensor histidine kinase [Sphingobium sp. CECT 9361]|uniref:sensor histidine kinase n=1 Tax=Sphingobium sp. CECT 9361 TaxID=2845384 RepID=UPI001E399B69|nr:HAMP domain-containing sensor histidine kinase [Sphingobium sp. CECT 9361]CAH0355354.1 Adaptive-response sensory-kinase SasA [Sphingobium sp. CECT 9361]
MTGASDIIRAVVDGDGTLISADPPIATLQMQAGSAIGGPLAVPQLAALARLSIRMNIPLSRSIVAACGSADIDMWVRAKPRDGKVELAVVEWRERIAHKVANDSAGREADLVATQDGWSWQIDPQLRILMIDADNASNDYPKVGTPLTAWFRITADEDGQLPILHAFAERRSFSAQQATGKDGSVYLLSGMPMFDAGGRLSGYRGKASLDVAEVERHAAPTETGTPLFGRRLDRALRQPLGRIIANADTISSQLEGPLREDYASYAADIATAGRHLMELVDDLADLQAIDRPDFTVTHEEIDLADLSRRAAGLLAVKAADRAIRVDVPQSDEIVPAVGEFRRTLQILVNLIGNAIRYSPEGSMIWVRAESMDGVAQVTIADQGRGIAHDDQDRIFDKFERLGRDEAGGSGLGLYISRRLARAMGGDITVDSAPGQGARFVLRLPGA